MRKIWIVALLVSIVVLAGCITDKEGNELKDCKYYCRLMNSCHTGNSLISYTETCIEPRKECYDRCEESWGEE